MIKLRISAPEGKELVKALRAAEKAYDVQQIKMKKPEGTSPFYKAYVDCYLVEDVPAPLTKEAAKALI